MIIGKLYLNISNDAREAECNVIQSLLIVRSLTIWSANISR